MRTVAIPEELPTPEEIRAARLSVTWTQRDVALRLDVTVTTVGRWENQKAPSPMPLAAWKGMQHEVERERRRLSAIGQLPADTDRPTMVPLPLVGSITAGSPAWQPGDVIEEVHVEADLVRRGCRSCVLTVSGDSMTGAGVLDGDRVIVALGAEHQPSDIVAVVLDDGETVLRRFRRRGRKEWLEADGVKDYPDLPLAGDERTVMIAGVVTGVRRVLRK